MNSWEENAGSFIEFFIFLVLFTGKLSSGSVGQLFPMKLLKSLLSRKKRKQN